jgi:hypothetical protein
MSRSRLAPIALIAAMIGFMGCAVADEADVDRAPICSKLDFSGINWSTSLPVRHREPFQLALNISGSFEGNHGWSNLADNFDGMGISLGLLNQNLGTGSLQPMFIDMRDNYAGSLGTHFSKENLDSLLDMLKIWQAAPASDDLLQFLRDQGYSELDDPEMIAQEIGVDPTELETEMQFVADRNSASVTWAKKNLMDNNKDLKMDWANQFKMSSDSAEYRSIQVKEAESLHVGAMKYYNHFKMTQLRSYLFFFDIVVQNGGLNDAVLAKYAKWLKVNPKSTENARLRKILALRLPYVRRKYRSDVQSRKLSIINGTGKVHQRARDYKKEFCKDVMSPMP